MLVKEAKVITREWVIQQASRLPELYGAYLAGSASMLPEDAELPRTSDLDVNVVLSRPTDAIKRGKVLYQSVLLDVTHLLLDQLRSPEQVLGHYHLAGGFRGRSVMYDPSGQLTALQAAVSRDFARPEWVRRRCQHAAETALGYARSLHEAAPLHDQVTTCVFSAGVTTHVLLVAGLQNPTVRRRYAAVRDLLATHGRLDFHEDLLALVGCADMDRQRVEQHLSALTAAFDAAKMAIKTPYRFGSDISDIARPIAIDGSRELIERGLHREAVFWIAATFSRCRTIFAADAQHLLVRFDRGYGELLTDLSIGSVQERRRRCEDVQAFLPRVWQVADAIIASRREPDGE